MNTGLQDAYNLAWKLALVVKGQADAALLGSYEEERVPVALRLLNTTDRAFRLAVSDSPLAGLIRTKILARIAAFAMSLKPIQAIAFRIVSQTGIHYRNGPLSETLEGIPHNAPRAGDRFPWLQLKFQANGTVEDSFQKLDDMHFNLVVIGSLRLLKAQLVLAICCVSTSFPLILSMTWNWHARRLSSPLSICCVPTAM